MTERTYGHRKLTLSQIDSEGVTTTNEADMIAHIRELEAENAKLLYRLNAAKERCDILMSEVIKLKVDRRELAMRVAEAVRKEVQAPNYGSYTSLQTIVEQELNK